MNLKQIKSNHIRLKTFYTLAISIQHSGIVSHRGITNVFVWLVAGADLFGEKNIGCWWLVCSESLSGS
jgi:hypothetical protein